MPVVLIVEKACGWHGADGLAEAVLRTCVVVAAAAMDGVGRWSVFDGDGYGDGRGAVDAVDGVDGVYGVYGVDGVDRWRSGGVAEEEVMPVKE